MVCLTCPACAAEVKPDDLICFTCGANLPRRRPDEDPPASATVMQEYLRREEGTGPLSAAGLPPPVPPRNVQVPARTAMPLRRDPRQAPVAPPLSAFRKGS